MIGIEEAIKFVKELNEEARKRKSKEDNNKITDFLSLLELEMNK